MATDTAYRSRADRPATHLWQVPAFLLGAAVVCAVVFGRPYITAWSPNSPDQLLEGVRAAMHATPPDYDSVIEQSQSIIARLDLPAKVRGEAHMLLGTSLLARLEPGASASQARHHLEQADQLGVPESEKNNLTVRLAKAWLLNNVEPSQIIPALSRIADVADDPFEAYGLLAEAYGRLNPPDTANVMEATRQQIARAPSGADPIKLARARLRMGELLVAAQNSREARIVLSRIGSDAPAEVTLAARKLLAKCHEQANDWAAAAKAWEQARTDTRLAPAEKAQVLYNLGRAYFNNQQLEDASVAWQNAVQLGGPDGQAAALRLAELRLATEPDAAVNVLAQAVAQVNPDTVGEMQALFERCVTQTRERGQFPAAASVAEIYARIAPPGRADELRGQIAASWGESLAKAGKAEEAFHKQSEAAKAFIAAGQAVPPGPEAAYRLWSATQAACAARDWKLALEALDKFLPLQASVPPERIAEAWYTIGLVHENLQDESAAKVSYQRCATLAPPWRFRARYQLAQIELTEARRDEDARKNPKLDEAERLVHELRAKVKYDDAEKMLQENLTELRQAVQAESAVQELTVYGLADIAHERGDHATAEPRLRGAIQEYPDSPLAVRARYRLAVCVWYKAVEENKALSSPKLTDAEKSRIQKQYVDNLGEAQEQYGLVEAALLKKKAGGPLSADEVLMLRRASFSVAELLLYAGRHAEAVTRFEELAARNQGKVEELHAIHQIWQCQFYYLHQKEKAVEQLTRLRDALEKLPPAAFDGSSEFHNKDYWVNKLVEMGKAQ